MSQAISFSQASDAGMGWVPDSVIHMLMRALDSHADKPALTSDGVTLNYREYAAVIAALAERWRRYVKPGDRVVLILPNSLDLAVAIYAVHALRAQVVALNPRYTARELSGVLADAQPVLVVYDDGSQFSPDLLTAALPAEQLLRIHAGAGFASMADAGMSLPDDLPGHNDLATLQYTSGTSGRPKGVNICHRQLAYNLAQREALLPTVYGQERVLCVAPLFHVSAVAMSLHLACYAASELVIHRRFEPAAALRSIATQAITLFSAVPTIFRGLMADPQAAHTDFSSLHYCYSGAAPLPETVLRQWDALTGCPILEGYGLSEAGPCLTYNPALGERKVGSVGLPVPLSQIQIVDVETGTQVLAAGVEGELRVRGPHVMAGYRNLPELTGTALRDGWFYSGDIATQDDDGYVYIKGRKQDAINVGGYTVHPREIEEVLLEHPRVAQAAAFAVPDAYYGETVQSWVVLRQQAAASSADLIDFCKANLVRYKVPTAIGFTTELPTNSTGKLIRSKLLPVKQQVA
ncbi:AMP-binding protein [Pusillimonas sp. MFBS29]|uniref:AMP-binding protein n=1 Tax=Pusillimonas sp. MFBS29 TaxID=2886690 RepID=UPI001D100A05|nr:AMP-binding protein [Pusillimonas sp. MFBS29]MCC2597160.1 AMP-binding protein [Pusillimonas sp. MFBS29]